MAQEDNTTHQVCDFNTDYESGSSSGDESGPTESSSLPEYVHICLLLNPNNVSTEPIVILAVSEFDHAAKLMNLYTKKAVCISQKATKLYH